MDERPTPETDAHIRDSYRVFWHAIVTHDFARKLERERDDYHRKACDIADERDRACERLAVVSLQLDDCKAQRDELLAAAQEFCDRVDRGEIRSVKTYARFKAAIAAVKGGGK